MTEVSLLSRVRPWIEGHIGVSLTELGESTVPVIVRPKTLGGSPLVVAKVGDRLGIVVDMPEWAARLDSLLQELPPDLLFSAFGCYELVRSLADDEIAVWGPNWHLFGDASTILSPADDRPELMEPSRLESVDFDLFWHCRLNSLVGFGVHDEGKLVALATVMDRDELVCEIGMEVAPDAMGRGLGRAVVAAAARWILDNGSLVLATVGPFNVPSARTLRSVGLRYLFMDIEGAPGPISVPPQTLGVPYPGATVYDYYPEWAMNHEIHAKPIPKNPS